MTHSATSTSNTPPIEFPAEAGVLLVGHGTRDVQGQGEFLEAARLLRLRMPNTPVEACFLELASPDIEAAVAALAEAGVRNFIAAPLLLFAAGHAKHDIPEAIDAAAVRHGRLAWKMAAPLGDHSAVLELSAQRFEQALADGRPTPKETALLFVARGSSDAEAIESVHDFAEKRQRLTPIDAQQVCFLAAAKPTLDESLAWAARQTARHIVVQPHLLFHGQLIQAIAARMQAIRGGSSEKTWHIAGHLGPSALLIDSLCDRLRQAGAG